MDTDDEVAKFYGKGNQAPYLGSDTFKDWAYRQRSTDEISLDRAAIQSFRPRLEEVVNLLAKQFKVDFDNIRKSQRGRVDENIPRWVAMYLGQEVCGLKLRDFTDYMGLSRAGSISTTIAKLKSRMNTDAGLRKQEERIKSEYNT